jgi:hypothetical protein
MRLFTLLAVLAALTVVAATAAGADSAVPAPPGSERTFVALLRPVTEGPADAFGLLLFRQPQDSEKVVFLDVWVLNLAPNRRYDLQRATDPTVDDQCTGTNWLTLGKGPAPEPIVTGTHGSGSAHLFRDLAAAPTGARFDIHFRLLDAATSAVVLTSPCYQFAVTP